MWKRKSSIPLFPHSSSFHWLFFFFLHCCAFAMLCVHAWLLMCALIVSYMCMFSFDLQLFITVGFVAAHTNTHAASQTDRCALWGRRTGTLSAEPFDGKEKEWKEKQTRIHMINSQIMIYWNLWTTDEAWLTSKSAFNFFKLSLAYNTHSKRV